MRATTWSSPTAPSTAACSRRSLPNFPDTAFAWGTSVETFGQPNISAYTTSSDEGAYAMGLRRGGDLAA